MSGLLQPPPTWALPIIKDTRLDEPVFNPVWLNWFLELVKTLQETKDTGNLPVIVSEVATTGFSFTFVDTTDLLIINGTATMATGSITLPPNPVNRKVITVASNQIIKALTVLPNTGQTLNNAPTCLNLGLNTPGAISGFGFSFVYRAADTTWYRIY